MRRSEKIRRFLEGHPRAAEHELQKKFGLSFREAKRVLAEYYGVIEVVVNRVSLRDRVIAWFRNIFLSEKQTMIFLVSIAALVRLGYIWVLSRHEVLRLPLLDAEYYIEWAQNIVAHGWLGDKVFFTEPLYAYFLALVLKIVGVNWFPQAVLGFQFLLGALFPVLLYFVGKKLLSRPIGVAAGLIAALYGPFVFYDGLLLKTSLEVYTLPLFLLLFWKTFERPRARSFFLLGLLLGGITLIKGNALIFAPLTGLLMFWFLKDVALKMRFIFIGLFLAGVIACIVPITLRNYVVGHDIVPTNYSIGLVFYQGNWWGGDGSTAYVPTFLRPHPKYEETDAVGMAESYVGHDLLPSEVSRFWIGKAFSEILATPGHFIATLWHKVLLLLNYREYSDNYSYAFYRSYVPFLWALPGYFVVATLGGAGWLLLFSRRFEEMIVEGQTSVTKGAARIRFRQVRLMLTLFFIAYIGVLLMTTINSRYRMPLTPFLILFSASLIIFCFHRFRERTAQGLGRLAVTFGVLLVLTVLPLSIFKHLSFADAYNNIGYWYYSGGQHEQAKEYFNKAIVEDNEYAWSYKSLAHIAYAEGRFSDAETLIKKLVAIRPDDLSNYEEVHLLKKVADLPDEEARIIVEEWLSSIDGEQPYDADGYEASRLLKLGDDAAAEAALLRSLEKHGNPLPTLLALASLKSEQKELPIAKQHLRAALAQNPDLFPARYNLANIFIQENNYKEVAELLAPIYAFSPELGETWYNYAVALIKTNRNAEAAAVAQAYVERYKDDASRQTVVKKFQDALKPSDSPLNDMVKNMEKK
ncbi:MAG: glycosyltransferase family 39 protein [Candidatus Moranbacteria bacterium]|nr:glycosyltransferase family 39 protein [Candidatus Moranbacteria bacterium]